jgi:hypothetical protein
VNPARTKERPTLRKLFKDADRPDPAREAALSALQSMWNADVQAATLYALERDSNADVRRLARRRPAIRPRAGRSDYWMRKT